eukprot:CAMPEP_0113936386 /NCGR_PEP_ID=MMETSP1339-20121228/3316_1 /TAXON_ID=94617 /ORGANISM="Fibrocapsa japonica" /LENGTH=314 /DNA_ID=CAMNT_0000938853 /DNA_START=67 /DNA_END=1008 /DNA_ORIENTATION=+ /assembly_acc=CAM_ASM_000762
MTAGTLKLTIKSGRNLRQTQMLGTDDPYVKIYVHQNQEPQRCQTRTDVDGGKNPCWLSEHEFRIHDSVKESLILEVMNKNTLSDDKMGDVQVPISKFTGTMTEFWVPISKGRRQAGEICLVGQFLSQAQAAELGRRMVQSANLGRLPAQQVAGAVAAPAPGLYQPAPVAVAAPAAAAAAPRLYPAQPPIMQPVAQPGYHAAQPGPAMPYTGGYAAQPQPAAYPYGAPAPTAAAAYGAPPVAAPAGPSYAQPGYAQPAYTQPGYAQPGYAQPGYGAPPVAAPAPAPAALPPGWDEGTAADGRKFYINHNTKTTQW